MQRKLYRVRKGSLLFGVCTGFARYFRLDVTLVRLVWVLITPTAGAGLLLYLIFALIIPREPKYIEE